MMNENDLSNILKQRYEDSFYKHTGRLCNNRVLPQYLPLEINDNFETKKEAVNFFKSAENFSDIGRNALIGAGIGGIGGLMYGYWDYIDEKKQSLYKGTKAPDKKLIIRDALVGAGLGGVTGAGLTSVINKIYASLEDKKATQENKRLYDSLTESIMRGNDTKKLSALLELKKPELTVSQYVALDTLIKSTTKPRFNRPVIPNVKVSDPPNKINYKITINSLSRTL